MLQLINNLAVENEEALLLRSNFNLTAYPEETHGYFPVPPPSSPQQQQPSNRKQVYYPPVTRTDKKKTRLEGEFEGESEEQPQEEGAMPQKRERQRLAIMAASIIGTTAIAVLVMKRLSSRRSAAQARAAAV